MARGYRLEREFDFEYDSGVMDNRADMYARISDEAGNMANITNEGRTKFWKMEVRIDERKGRCFVKVFVRDTTIT